MKRMSSYENAQAETGDLPFGAFSNETSVGSDDGTTIVAEHLQDLYYALYQVLQLAGMTPNGSLENGNQSKQFLSALSNVAPILYNNTTTYNKNALVVYVYNDEINLYKSLAANNTASLSDATKWKLLYKINSSGIFGNMSLLSPALSGTPTAPTAAAGTANKQIATTEFVKQSMRNFIKITTGVNAGNTFTVSPPAGFTMADLAGFIPSINTIHYSGDVDGNDSSYCRYSIGASYITVTVYSSEQRAATHANWLAIWIKS